MAKAIQTRNFLTETERSALFKAAALTRNGKRDAFMLEFAYRHGLRSTELVNLKWEQLNLDSTEPTVFVQRAKNGTSSEHPLTPAEVKYFRSAKNQSDYVFISEQGSPFTERAIRKMVNAAGERAGFKFKAHSHMLRHTCGYVMANMSETPDIRLMQDYLGHKNIQHTVRYTQVNSKRFAKLKTIL